MGESLLSSKTAAVMQAGARERQRRAEALRRHRADARARRVANAGEVSYLRARLRLASRLAARLARTNDVAQMAELVVEELHGTFAFHLAAVQRLGGDGVLRLVASRGRLAVVITEFLLLEQPVSQGINGRVARTGTTALLTDTRADADYVVRDRRTDPRSELSVPVISDGCVWGVLNLEAPERGAFSEVDAVLVETIAASLGSAVYRAAVVDALLAELQAVPSRRSSDR